MSEFELQNRVKKFLVYNRNGNDHIKKLNFKPNL